MTSCIGTLDGVMIKLTEVLPFFRSFCLLLEKPVDLVELCTYSTMLLMHVKI